MLITRIETDNTTSKKPATQQRFVQHGTNNQIMPYQTLQNKSKVYTRARLQKTILMTKVPSKGFQLDSGIERKADTVLCVVSVCRKHKKKLGKYECKTKPYFSNLNVYDARKKLEINSEMTPISRLTSQ